MKKTLLASAIAAATFSGAVAAQESNMPTVYGNIQYAITHQNVDDGPSQMSHFDNGSTLGVKHEHAISPGVTGFFKLELDGFGADEKDSDGANIDEAYIGVKGDSFGQVWVGSDDSTFERSVDKIGQYYEAASLSINPSYSTGEGDSVQYQSPSFGGLTFGAQVQINGDGEAAGAAKSFPYQLAATYAMDAFEISFAVDSNDNKDGNAENTYGLAGSYNAGDFSLIYEYSTRADAYDKMGLMGLYAMGANQFALSYELATADNAADTEWDTITLQVKHNVSNHMYVYFEGYLGGGDDVYDFAFERADSSDFDASTGVSDQSAVAAIGAVYYF